MTRSPIQPSWRDLEPRFIELIVADGYNRYMHDGQVRLRRMRQAWTYMLQHVNRGEWPTLVDIKELGYLIEPVKNIHFRKVPREDAVSPELIESTVDGLMKLRWDEADAVEKIIPRVQFFEAIQPFVDGNARVAHVLGYWWTMLVRG